MLTLADDFWTGSGGMGDGGWGHGMGGGQTIPGIPVADASYQEGFRFAF